MRAEIVTVGNEILSGDTVDTNSAFIGRKLTELGVQVEWITSVGDREENIRRAFETALDRVDLVIVTGGLGPTHDDATKKVFARLFQKRLVLNEQILRQVRAKFQKRGMAMPQVNVGQAMVPEGVELLENRFGTAPGFHLEQRNKHIFLLPGVPREMRQMLEEGVLPVVSKLARGEEICRLTLRTTGISESALFERLKGLKEMATVAFLPGYSGVDIRITARGSRAGERVKTTAQQIHKLAGDFVYGVEKETLEEVVGRQLKRLGLKLAVAESCTGGLIAHRLTNIPGSSDYFERGVITYSNESKVQLLGVPAETIRRYGAVSVQTAEAMASGVRKLADTDIGLSTTGIAGPTGATPTKPIGLVFIGLSTPEKTVSKKFQFGEDRLVNKERMSQAALEMLWRKLKSREAQ